MAKIRPSRPADWPRMPSVERRHRLLLVPSLDEPADPPLPTGFDIAPPNPEGHPTNLRGHPAKPRGHPAKSAGNLLKLTGNQDFSERLQTPRCPACRAIIRFQIDCQGAFFRCLCVGLKQRLQ
jgi:hypothetical protein